MNDFDVDLTPEHIEAILRSYQGKWRLRPDGYWEPALENENE